MKWLRPRPRLLVALGVAGLLLVGGLGGWLLSLYAFRGANAVATATSSQSGGTSAFPSQIETSGTALPTFSPFATGSAPPVFSTGVPQQGPSGSRPVQREAFQMAYDGKTQTVVLFGGTSTGNSAEPLGDTWTWNGTEWQQQHPTVSPPARALGNLAYDDATGQLVLFGGLASGGQPLNDTWTWDGSTWLQLQPASSPSPRMEALMAYDDAIRKLVLFAGQAGTFYTDTWEWDGTNWTQIVAIPAGVNPTSLDYTSMAYHAGSGRLVFLDSANDPTKPHTWVFDGAHWSLSSPATNPPWRAFESLARDDAFGLVVMFGGTYGSLFPNETWTWDGSTWTLESPATSPPPRSSGGTDLMTYDAARRVVVLFGGLTPNNQLLGDTWTWDGANWTQVS